MKNNMNIHDKLYFKSTSRQVLTYKYHRENNNVSAIVGSKWTQCIKSKYLENH